MEPTPVAGKYISASEISEYAYCARAWWYRRHGERSANLARLHAGTVAHDRLQRAAVALLKTLAPSS